MIALTRPITALLLAASLPAMGQACTVPDLLPFAPPLDTAQRLTVASQRATRDGSLQRFALEYRLDFRAVGQGFAVTATLMRVDAPSHLAAGRAMAAIFAPLQGRPVDMLIDTHTGRLTLGDGDALWRQIADDMAARSAATGPSEGRALASALLALPPAERETMLMGDLLQMLRFAGRPVPPGATPVPPTAGGCALHFSETVQDKGPATEIQRETRWSIDAKSGLAQEQHEERWLITQAGAPPVAGDRITRSLAPWN